MRKKSFPVVMKTCFSEGKLMKRFGTSPFLREPPISEQFFHDPLFVRILKTRSHPNFRGKETMGAELILRHHSSEKSCLGSNHHFIDATLTCSMAQFVVYVHHVNIFYSIFQY